MRQPHHRLITSTFFLLYSLLSSTFSLFPYTTLFRSNSQEAMKRAFPCASSWGLIPPHPIFIWATRWCSTKCASSRIWAIRLSFRSEEHTSELQSRFDLVCRLLLEKKKATKSYVMCWY